MFESKHHACRLHERLPNILVQPASGIQFDLNKNTSSCDLIHEQIVWRLSGAFEPQQQHCTEIPETTPHSNQSEFCDLS